MTLKVILFVFSTFFDMGNCYYFFRGDCMQLLDGMVENAIYLLFPILAYLIYVSYIRNLDKDEKDIFLEFALFTSLFLMIRYGKGENYLYNMALFNVPVLIAYLKKKNIIAILLSFILILFYYETTDIHIGIFILEYFLYFINCNYINKYKKNKLSIEYIINNFVAIKSFIMAIQLVVFIDPNGNIIKDLFLLIFIIGFFTVCSYLILYFLTKCEEIVDLDTTLQELKKEKKLRESMFKIAHEVKNPLAVCKGYLQMIDYSDQDKIKRYIPIISDEIDRSLVIMNDFSDFGKIKVVREETDLEMLIEDTCSCFSSIFKENGIETDFKFIDDEIYMELDYNRIKQVLVNIFKNSIEAKIDNKVMKISLNIKRYTDFVKIIISDNGCGMSKENLNRVDEMFYTTKDKGTGLGVALSKEIIELHGGTIKYSSTLGKGTTATINLPYKEKKS